MKVECFLYSWIWPFQFQVSKVANDLNVFEVSKHFGSALNGVFHLVT